MVSVYVLHFVSVFRPTKLAILNVVNFMEQAPIEWPVCEKIFLMRTVVVSKVGTHGIPSDFIFRILPFYEPLY